MTAGKTPFRVSRRNFLESTAAGVAAALLPLGGACTQRTARYTRYNASSPQGQAMLLSYAVAIRKMLDLPPTDARNWFRNAFIHTMDCPHGNWWFFVWHRGYLGWFERTVRALSRNPHFALPYWDWTQSPRIPDQMFDGVLTPTNSAFDPYISSYDTFFNYMNPAMEAFWAARPPDRVKQLNIRQMPSLDALWSQVKNNPMYSPTPHARYQTRASPQLDEKTAKMCSLETVTQGLAPTTFFPFNSGKTPSHNTEPGSGSVFSVLEGLPHNNVHNNIGGVHHVRQSELGYMQDNLSPTDPIFFLHHSNMDRLWDVWTRRQQAMGLPTLPTGEDLALWENEPFLFYIDANGDPVEANKAGEYATIDGFDYDYQPGSGEEVVVQQTVASGTPKARFSGEVLDAAATVAVPPTLVAEAGSGKGGRSLAAEVTLPHPASATAQRNFDVLVNAPPDLEAVDASSPHYAATIAFFGYMPGMTRDATFIVPLGEVLGGLQTRNLLGAGRLNIRVVPQRAVGAGVEAAPPAKLKAVSIRVW